MNTNKQDTGKKSDRRKLSNRPKQNNELELRYIDVRLSGLHLIEWSGKQAPSIGHVIQVSQGSETVGQLVVLKETRRKLGCRFIGKEIDRSNLGQYTLTYLGNPKSNKVSSSIFEPDEDIPKEYTPQIALHTGASFGDNEILDITFDNSLDQRLESVDLGITLSLPPVENAQWMNWFYFSFFYQQHTSTLSQVVIGEGRQTVFSIEDESMGMQLRGGIRIPLGYRLLSSLELYLISKNEEHQIKVESSLAGLSDQVSSLDESTEIGGAYSIRLVDNLFVSFFFQQTLDSEFNIKPEKTILEAKQGEAEQIQFGMTPYIYYEIWDIYPKFDLKLNFSISQSQTNFKLINPDTQKASITEMDHLKVQTSLRIGMLF